jgi:hypothetical protein
MRGHSDVGKYIGFSGTSGTGGIFSLKTQQVFASVGEWGKLGTEGNPATSGRAIYTADPTSPTGTYYLRSPGGVVYQAYIKMDQGGGWINLNKGALGPYTTPLTSFWNPSYGSDMLAGGSTTFGAALNANSGIQNQNALSCSGSDGRSGVVGNATMLSELGVTQVRWKSTTTSINSSTTCGYDNTGGTGLVIISGTAAQFSTCANVPNNYGAVAGGNHTVEGYQNLPTGYTANTLVHQWTACGGNYNKQLVEVYIR